MIKNKKSWEAFERKLNKTTKADYRTNLKIFEELLAYAKKAWKISPKKPA